MPVTWKWLVVFAMLTTPASLLAQTPPAISPRREAGSISVWLNGERPYQKGDKARVYFRTEGAGYVTVLRVDTDGRIRILFPREPWRQNFVRAGRTLESAESRQLPAFTVDEHPGIGYILAVTSRSPFEYGEFTRGDYWDFRTIGDERIRGDPYVALTDLARRIAPVSYRYDIAPYYVNRHYEYPRFVCYDCHTYASYDAWDPYTTSCARYRIVIYDDPAYYPYRYSQGRNVVTSRPLRPAPRYVFKEAEPGREYVTRLRQRESHAERRARIDRDRSANGRGAVASPAPGAGAGAAEPKAFRRRTESAPILRRLADPVRDQPDVDTAPRAGRSRRETEPPVRVRPAERERQKIPPIQRGARDPQSTGEPELRRRKP